MEVEIVNLIIELGRVGGLETKGAICLRRLGLRRLRRGVCISTLHEQRLRKRTTVITEDPGLHLCWYYGEIYLKPIPKFLFSFDFWGIFLGYSEGEMQPNNGSWIYRSAALGFMRTYVYLVQHESDFHLPQEQRLIPSEISFNEFRIFIERFRDIPDDKVSLRWRYGQLCLTRLNWAVLIVPVYPIVLRP
jgi:hypothetical protein